MDKDTPRTSTGMNHWINTFWEIFKLANGIQSYYHSYADFLGKKIRN